MPFVSAICPNCGGILDVNSSNDAAICKYCGSPFIVEKAVEIFNTNNNFNVNASVVNYYSNNTLNNAKEHFENAKKYYVVGAYEQSYKEYMDARACAPDDGEIIFWGMMYSRLNTEITKYSKKFMGITPKEYVAKFPEIQQYEIDLLKMNSVTGDFSFYEIGKVYYRLFFGMRTNAFNTNDENVFDANRCLYLYRLNWNLSSEDIKWYIKDAYNSMDYNKIRIIFENDTIKAFDPYFPEQLRGNKRESFYNIVKNGLSYIYTYRKCGGGGDWEESEKIVYPQSPEIARMVEQYYPRKESDKTLYEKPKSNSLFSRLFNGRN